MSRINSLSLLSADLVITNARVITMDPKQPNAEAVAVKEGKIIGVGSNHEIKQYCSLNTERIDLKGRTLLPGFIETHDHMIYYATKIDEINAGVVCNKNIDDILNKIKQQADALPQGEWILGWGFDDTGIEENRHLTKWDLDKVAPHNPILIVHVSGHLGTINSSALDRVGITRDTLQPKGGKIYKTPDGEPSGLLAEIGALGLVIEKLPPTTMEKFIQGLRKCNDIYLKAGVTTIHDAGIGIFSGQIDLDAYFQAINNGDLSIRVNGMIIHYLLDVLLENRDLGLVTGSGNDKFRIGAAKIVQGGSIQGLTAALFDPYLCDETNMGFLIYEQEKLNEKVLKYHKAGFQVAIHANGDREVESALLAFEYALENIPKDNHRHRIEHCQMATEDQLARMGRLGICASFFPVHVYYWGDRHRDLFIGPHRAAKIDPLSSALKHGVIFGLHNDCPVTPVSPLNSLYSAVARETSSGKLLGKEQGIGVTEALKALTINAAYLGFEENIKGSIERGKLADFVILSDDPYILTPSELKDLEVLMTIIDGKIKFSNINNY